MRKNPLPEDLIRSSDESVVAINSLKEEADALALKFGTTSPLYKKKLAQVETLRKYYKASSSYIEKMLELNIKLGAAALAQDIEILQIRHGLSFRQATEILKVDFSEGYIQRVEMIDDLIKALTKAPIEDQAAEIRYTTEKLKGLGNG